MEDELIEVITTKKTNNIATKKKKSHMFEIYISKVLKQISTVNGITTNAKQQLNSAICHILKYVCSLTFKLVASSKKKTITLKEIENSLRIVLQGELLLCALKEGNKSCDNISSSKKENINSSRQNKACIIFPPSIVEKYLRNFGSSTIMVSSLAPVFLASVIEFISFEILDLSINFCKENKHSRITIRDLELSVRSDLELSNLFNKLNLSFLGGGVVPYIHPSLFNKIIKKKKNTNTNTTVTPATQHRFRYGTMAIKNIRKNQKISNTLILAKTTFEKIIRNSVKKQQLECSSNVKISKEVFVVIQYFIEQYIVKILSHSNYLSIHAGRVKVIPNDILLYLFFQNEQPNPYVSSDLKLFSLEDDFNNDGSLHQSLMSSSTLSDNSLMNNSDENHEYDEEEDNEEQVTIEQFTMS
jgi:histone H2A